MKKIICVFLLLISIYGQSYIYSGALNATTQYNQLTLNISFTTQTKVVAVIFKPLNTNFNQDLTNVLIVAKFTPIIRNLYTPQKISQYLATGDNQLMFMRPTDAMGGYTQVINMPIPNDALLTDKLIIGIFNYDFPDKNTTKQYNLRIETLNQGKICPVCPFGTYLYTGLQYLYKCQCGLCRGNRVGSICQYHLDDIRQGQSQYFNIDNRNNKYYRIYINSLSAKLNIYSGIPTNTTRLYIQYQSQQSNIAGKINHHLNNNPLKYVINSSQSMIQITNYNKPALLTFYNYGNLTVPIYIQYISTESVFKPVNIGLLTGLLFVGIVIIVIVIVMIRRWYLKRHAVASSTVIMNQNAQNTNKFTQQQVNDYFPLLKAFYVIEKDKLFQQKSLVHLNSVQQENSASRVYTDYQCAICFQMIKYMEDVRVVYCKHIFHDKCLLSWFQKNLNCPICRKVFDYQSTKKMYKQVCKRKNLRGKDLGRAILGVSGPANRPKISQKQLQQKEQKSNNYEEEVQSSQYRQD